MLNPRVQIDLEKLKYNTERICSRCRGEGINVMGVTKAFCGIPEAVNAMVEGGISYIADSRLENLMKLQGLSLPKVLLRIPMQSEVEYVVKYSDLSLNSEVDTIRKISAESLKQGKTHRIILMIDLGDLREGIWFDHIYEVFNCIIGLKGIEIAGIGTNLTCYGGVIPTYENISRLCEIGKSIRAKYGIDVPIISGGNSSSLYLIKRGEMPAGITNLRIGEAILLGRETAFGSRIEGLYDDVFKFIGEIIEVKEKPSVPVGNIGMDAFGCTPAFIDRGIRKRAIIAAGRQDISLEGMFPIDEDIMVIGASSDHLIIDITESKREYKVGSEVEFKISYGCLLQSMTSIYVKKVFK
jgi:predicted amino acid racemase